MELGGIIAFFIAILIGPPIVFLIIGGTLLRKNRDRAKIFFILAVVYLIVAGGICYSMLM